MALTKADLIKQASELGIEVDPKLKISDITKLIHETTSQNKLSQRSLTAKSGKRSAKAILQTAEKITKELKKQQNTDLEQLDKSKKTIKTHRSRLEKRSKAYQKSYQIIDRSKKYDLSEAIKLAKNSSFVKFNASVELHLNLAVDPRKADQNVRDSIVLPHGSGKNLTVAVIVEEESIAKSSGADIINTEQILSNLDKGIINFNVLIAHPSQMAKISKYARILGPRGLMPNPKSGTVSTNINKAVAEAKAGRVEYRVDSNGIVHLAVGKINFADNQLKDNIEAVYTSINANKPTAIKGSYVKSAHLSTSMGPSVPLDINSL
jgi:large subunit ribosomal protein L1